jgi:hypothetical protein
MLYIRVLLLLLIGAAHALRCYQGSCNVGGVPNVTAVSCNSAQPYCLKCLVPKSASFSTNSVDYYSYACANDAFKNLVESFGAQNCVQCNTDVCNTGAHTVAHGVVRSVCAVLLLALAQ